MLKRIGNYIYLNPPPLWLWVLVFFLLVCAIASRAEVCIRPVFPFGKEQPTQMVLAELAKRNIQATVCGEQPQPIEIYFYPLDLSLTSDETTFWISAQPTSTGVTGVISTYRNHWNEQVWVVSVHPWGGEESSKRLLGFGLKSQTGKLAKWIKKNV